MAEPDNIQTSKASRFKGGVSLRYPYESQDDYKGVIRFAVLKDEPQNLENAWKSLGKLAKEGLRATAQVTEQVQGGLEEAGVDTGQAGQAVRQQTTSIAENTASVNKFNGADETTLENVTIQEADPGRVVEMYLPVGLVYRDNVGYENIDLGISGGAAEAAMRSGGNVTLGAMTSIDQLKSAAGTSQASLATVRVLEKIPGFGAGASAAARSVAQVTVNPNSRSLFKSVSIREFSFTFKFLPVSQKEAQEVERIIQLFREELYPETISLGATEDQRNVSIGYKFPNKFGISIMYDGKRIGTKILPCFLRDVNVTYNPTNMAMHSDGQFNEIDMTLAFTEHRTLDRDLVARQGY